MGFCWQCYAVDSREEGSGAVCSSAAYGSPSSRDTHIPRIWKRKGDEDSACHERVSEDDSEDDNERSELAQGRVHEYLTTKAYAEVLLTLAHTKTSRESRWVADADSQIRLSLEGKDGSSVDDFILLESSRSKH